MGTPNEGISGTLATGLIGHWDFDAGSLLDISGNNYTLIKNESVDVGSVGYSINDKDDIENNAWRFEPYNGVQTEILKSLFDSTQQFSTSFYIRTNEFASSNYLLATYFSTGWEFGLNCYITDGKFRVSYFKGGIGGATVSENIDDGDWHNVVITNGSGATLKIYLDGAFVAETGDTYALGLTSNIVEFGFSSHTTPNVSGVDIDEIRLYNKVLNATEVLEIFEMGVNYTPIIKCDTPTFSKSSGSYPQEPFNVEITTATSGASIYYTTDGTNPDSTKTLYIEPITITKTTTLKAIAIKEDFENSDIAIVQYDLSDITFVKTKHNIRVLEPDLTLVAEIDTYTSFTFQRKLYNAGRFTLILNYYTTNALELTMNRLIMLDNNPYKVGIIKGVKYIQEGNNETLEVTGFELKGIFKQRVTIPDSGQSHQKFSKTNFETILKGLVQKQCIDNTTMKFNRLEVVANTNKGFEFGFETRYKKLDEEIEKISRNAEIGYQVYLDFESKKWKFDIIRSNVVLDENAFLPIFSAEYDNMERQEFESDTSESKNYAIVAGQGEGADRTIKIVQSEIASDIDLSVMFADARDINTDTELEERGTLKLTEAASTYSFDCDIIDGAPFVYEIDWDLGDMVQIVSKKMGVKITKLVEEVTEFYQVGTDRKINAVFGKATPGIRKYIDTTNDVGID